MLLLRVDELKVVQGAHAAELGLRSYSEPFQLWRNAALELVCAEMTVCCNPSQLHFMLLFVC